MAVVDDGDNDDLASGDEEDLPSGMAVGGRDIFRSDEPAAPPEPLAGTEREHQRKFRWWALIVISTLCVFFGLATLLVGALASQQESIQMAGDVAKTSIPTLLTLLGTAVAWAFKSEKDE